MAKKGMFGAWDATGKVLGQLGNRARWNNARRRAVLKECHRLRGIMIKSFNAGGPPGKKWKALSTFTQLVNRAKGKGDRRPLMDSGDLRNSHSVVEQGRDVWFVGIHRTAKGRKSRKGMVNLGLIHEYGTKTYSIKVSTAMRYWWKNWLVPRSKRQIKPLNQATSVIVIRIPPRPWIGPIWDMEEDNSADNIMSDTIANLAIPGLG